MDLFVKIGLTSLVLTAASLMLYFTLIALDSMEETRSYVNKQNQSDAYATKYASLSPFNYETVGVITVQEALTLIFNNMSDEVPIIVKNSTTIKAFVNSRGTWQYKINSGFGRAFNADGSVDTANNKTELPAQTLTTEPVTSYDNLRAYLVQGVPADRIENTRYAVDIDPLHNGSLSVISVVFQGY